MSSGSWGHIAGWWRDMPNPGLTISHKVEGLEELIRKVDAVTLLSGPLRRFFERATLIVVRFTKLRAPYRTGRLQGGITKRIDPRPLPLWGQVATGVTHKGVSYPTVLEMGHATRKGADRSILFHYRATARKGQFTRGWWSGGLADSQREIGEAMDAMGREVEAAWKA